ncbi:MAG: type II toxin-antitoxin system VapC family toxin [Acidobacteria bacterium]|nr:MAG: type II toxin-antitoxin system VapC family toxin [Acidobacteriota bacterium]
MIVDTSAVIAIAFNEPEAELFLQVLLAAGSARLSAPNYVEASVVIRRYQGDVSLPDLDETLRLTGIEIAAFLEEHGRLARKAYARYGRGSGHRARLNLGDCFSYALARATGESLLYKGEDFAHTDVRPALVRH